MVSDELFEDFIIVFHLCELSWREECMSLKQWNQQDEKQTHSAFLTSTECPAIGIVNTTPDASYLGAIELALFISAYDQVFRKMKRFIFTLTYAHVSEREKEKHTTAGKIFLSIFAAAIACHGMVK